MTGGFGGIVRFEVGYYLRRISTWVYFGIFLLLGFLLIHLAGGAWESVQVSMGGSGGNVHVNSPYATVQLSAVLSLFGILVTAALVGNAICRDFDTGVYPLFFTTPISRASYLGGRFTGSILVNAFILASVPLGLALGSLMPYLDRERFGPFSAISYLQPFLVFLLPNLLLTGAIFFALAALTRRMLPNYVGGIFLLIGYMMAGEYMQDLENDRLVGMLDAFGFGPYELVARYWTPAEKNTLLAPLDGLLLSNRLAWLAVGAAILALAFVRFRFSHEASERRTRRKVPASAGEPAPVPGSGIALPAVHPSYGAAAQWAQYRSIARQSFWSIVRNRYFFAIAGGGVLYMVLMSSLINEMYGTTIWPVTYAILEVLGPNFWIFMLVIITLYAGDLVWAERDVKINQVVDATPMRDWVPLAGKWTGLALMLVVLQAVVMLTGMVVQAAQGYTNFEVGLYLKSLFGMDLISFLLLSVFVMLVHVLANHKYVAHLLVILFLVFTAFMPEMGFEHNLYRFNSGSSGMYSDMNRFGPFPERFFWLKAYWMAWAVLLAIASNLFWVRGQETGASWRVRLARRRFRRPAAAGATVAGLLILGLGGFIFYNTNIVNPYRTRLEAERVQAEYERDYKRFEGIAQPRVVGVDLTVELYPQRRHATVGGYYRVRNKTAVAIDSVHVMLPSEVKIRRLAFDRPAEQVVDDRRHGYHIFALEAPLQPGDSMRLELDVEFGVRGFTNREQHLELVENGTFFNSGLLPSFGYDPNAELASDEVRRKHDLAPKERVAPLEDTAAARNNYISRDADWIDFAVTVGTVPDQIALAPGYLQREWTVDDRRYFRYEMDSPILNMYSVLSARYVVERDRWRDPSAGSGQGVAIEVYHHPGHEYNVARMIDAVKKSLQYFVAEFGPYQHRQLRIVEFPRYQTFAQSFPNTVPYSEGIGFIARVKDEEEDVDYPFYVTAHEVAHQWWAHQVIGGNVQGSTLMSETLSQYSALMVMEKEFGREQIRKFLEYELDSYLQGRGFEQKKELPLLRVEGQPYIHYNKGAVVMYALRDLIGEEALNGALRSYLQEVQYQEPPYTTALDLYAHLQAATPDSLRATLTDLFEHITLYDNRIRGATVAEADGAFRVTLDFETRKLRADSLGNEAEVPMADWVDVGIFAANPEHPQRLGEEIYLRKHRLEAGRQTLTIEVPTEPARAGIDPYHKLIDRNSDDNVVRIEKSEG